MTIDSLIAVLQAHFAHRGLALASKATGRPLDGLAEIEALMELAEVAADSIRPLRWDEEPTREMPAFILEEALNEMESK